MFIVKMLLGKIRLWMVSPAKLLFPTASRQRALNGEPEQGRIQRPERRICRLRFYKDLCPVEETGQRQMRGKLVSFKVYP